ncbi:hypothetical protein HMN09_00842500 [Mycena chlorophos]|uniref:CxC6 like cysteine cluster associated with KDZ domain-containing protein n=1 Tax=Mycena chlorophos TaxID=658473 RepID=A0A8H6W9R0_MYCCL|nr:hypothetical protein HMN09_00842500 [Mycena chlorophos]
MESGSGLWLAGLSGGLLVRVMRNAMDTGRAHQYVEQRVLDLFINLMLISWTSATNGARIYDACLSKPEEQPSEMPDWAGTTSDAAKLYAFHTGEQRFRFTKAMDERNARIRLVGQPEWAHYCNRCMRVWEDEKGNLSKIHVVVIDGITIGHPCCGVLHCPTPLASNRDRYCPDHVDEDKKCAVEGCGVLCDIDNGFLTCSDPGHRHLETVHKKRDKAMFQLRTRRTAEITAEEFEEMEILSGDCPATKDPNGNRKIRALFGRRKSHNEQIIVRPCGMIIARATFFGSETVTQTADFIHKTFRTKDSMPDIVFYDNNCSLYKHLVHVEDPLVKTVGFPVDPASLPELIGEQKAWHFNSSIAEQTNVWLGGFHAILREMGASKFDFFLDEMIMRKNKLTLAKLEAEGACPGLRPL